MTYNKIRGVLKLAPMTDRQRETERERSGSFPKINKPV